MHTYSHEIFSFNFHACFQAIAVIYGNRVCLPKDYNPSLYLRENLSYIKGNNRCRTVKTGTSCSRYQDVLDDFRLNKGFNIITFITLSMYTNP
jgi:hypothetical protein